MAIAKTFRIDPLVVLDETDPFRRTARVAAVELVAQWERDAQQRAKAKG